MPAGLQIFDASGVPTMDVTTKYTRVLGAFVAGTAGSLSNSLLTTGIPFAATTIIGDPGYHGVGLEISFSGATMSWNWPTYGTKMNTVIVYGVN